MRLAITRGWTATPAELGRRYVTLWLALPVGVVYWNLLQAWAGSQAWVYALAYGPVYFYLYPWARYAGWTVTLLLAWLLDELRAQGAGWRGPLGLAVWHDLLLLGAIMAPPAFFEPAFSAAAQESPQWNAGLWLGAVGLTLVHAPLLIMLLVQFRTAAAPE